MSTKARKKDARGSLEGAIIFWMHRVDRKCRNEVLSRFRSRGYPLSAIQWEVLTMLWQQDGAIQTVLAEATGTDKASMTRILDRMVRDELVERRMDPDDRRAFRIHLTTKGKVLHTKLLPIVEEVIKMTFDSFNSQQLTALQNGLKQMFYNLDHADAADQA